MIERRMATAGTRSHRRGALHDFAASGACVPLLLVLVIATAPARAQCPPRGSVFVPGESGAIPDPAMHVAVADFNSDGIPDLAMGGTGRQLTIKLGTLARGGPVAYIDGLSLPIDSPVGFVTGDFNGDQIPDLAIVSQTADQLVIELGSGRGSAWTMSSAGNYITPEQPYSVAAGDVNGDGNVDLVVTCFLASTLSTFLGNGDGTFGGRSDYFTGGAPGEVQLADLNHDGLLDVVTANFTRSGVTVLLGNGGSGVGGGLFQTYRVNPSNLSTRPLRLGLGDFDGDGVLDCALAQDVLSSIDVMQGYITETGFRFFSNGPQQVGPHPGGIAVGDFDHDGHLDVATTLLNPVPNFPLAVMFGSGDLYLSSPFTFQGPAQAAGIAAADLDGDAVTDLVVVSNSGNFQVYWGACLGGPPEITSFTPVAGAVGDTVTIQGTGFKSVTNVRFRKDEETLVEAPIITHAVSAITVRVPAGATSGPITLEGGRGNTVSTSIFQVGEKPSIVAAVPDSAKAGRTVNLLGRHFAGTQQVSFGSDAPARFEVISDTLLQAVVDTLSRTGPIEVRTLFGRAVSAFAFTVIPPDTAPTIERVEDVPNDQGGFVTVTWIASDLDVIGRGLILSYAVSRRDDAAWVDVASVPASSSPRYSAVVPTRADSTSAGIPYQTFMVRSVTDNPNARYESKPDSGYSVDNLPPARPDSLSASYDLDRFELEWRPNHEPDFAAYAVHRGDFAGFTATPENEIARVHEPRYADTLGANGHYFQVIAIDVHGNESPPGELAIDAMPIPSRLGLARLGPNPTADRLSLALALPTTDPVRIEVIDLAGRRVLHDRLTFAAAGFQRLQWNAVGSLRPGVYFLRLQQGRWNLARRFVVAR